MSANAALAKYINAINHDSTKWMNCTFSFTYTMTTVWFISWFQDCFAFWQHWPLWNMFSQAGIIIRPHHAQTNDDQMNNDISKILMYIAMQVCTCIAMPANCLHCLCWQYIEQLNMVLLLILSLQQWCANSSGGPNQARYESPSGLQSPTGKFKIWKI